MVDQTIFADGKGNCLAACVASILDLPIEAVPNFAESGYFDGLHQWLGERGLKGVSVRFPDADAAARVYVGYSDDLILMWGDSPRLDASGKRKGHAVVGVAYGYGFRAIHDPHPSREGLHGGPFGVMWIVPKASRTLASERSPHGPEPNWVPCSMCGTRTCGCKYCMTVLHKTDQPTCCACAGHK